MEPENLRFGGGASETLMHPVVALWLLVAIILIISQPREKAIVPFLVACFTIPIGQVVLVGGLHFTAIRVVIVAGLARMLTEGRGCPGRGFPGGFNAIDRVVVLWTVSALTVISLQWQAMAVVVKNLGDFLGTFGGYLVVRYLIPDGKAVRRTIRVLAAICVIHATCMINEQINHFNAFGLFGGASVEVSIRNGIIRSSGLLGYLYSGVIAGASIPLFVWLSSEGKSRLAACAGVVAAMVMTFTSNSSTSLLAFGGSAVGIAFWPLRERMRLVRWGLALALVALHLAMKAPVWALIARVDLTGSSSSYHRFYLLDNCIRHFSDWWLFGYKHYNEWGWGMWDLCNQFVAVAVTGGLVSVVFYIAIFSRSFGSIGAARKRVSGEVKQEWFLWCLGSSLFAHVVASFGSNYMTPLLMWLYPLLACISVATLEVRRVVDRSGSVGVRAIGNRCRSRGEDVLAKCLTQQRGPAQERV